MPNLPSDLPWAGCPKPEIVAAYVDGRLDAGDRARMAGHLADCNDCSTVFAEAIRMQRAAAGRQYWMMVPTDRRSLLKLAGSLGVAAALCLAVWPARNALSTTPSSDRPELAQLVEAVGSRRTIEPRLTGGFAYGTLPTADLKRSGESASVELPLELRAAAIALEKQAQGASDPLALGAFGSAQLATGLSEKAVATFEEATRLLPKDARLLSDTAAAYLVRSRDKNQIEDVARAVGFAQQAVEAAPSLAEARFNLALSLEGLSLRGEATKSWKAYLEVDPASPWADEAKRRIERLAETPEARWEKQRRVVITASDSGGEEAIRAATKQFPDTAYEFVENDLVPGWADAWLARNELRARELARRARLFGQALADGVGERMALEVAVSIERAHASKPQADVLARGHQVFRDARALYEQDKVGEAGRLFAIASADLRQGRSAFVYWATLYLAISEYVRERHDAAAILIEPLLENAAANSYVTLLGRGQRMRGLLHHVRGDVADSLDYYRRALSHFNKVVAKEDIAAIQSSIAENLEALGDPQNAWRSEREALAELEFTRTARRRHTILLYAAKFSRRQGLPRAALPFQDELLSDALRTKRAGAVVEAYLARAEVHHLLGNDRLAVADLQQVERSLVEVSDPALARRHEAEVRLAQGEILPKLDPARALDALSRSLAYFREAGREQRLARFYLAMGHAHLAAGQLDQAEASWLDGITTLERQRSRLPSGGLRLGYFDQPWNLFDEMIRLQATRPERMDRALGFAERLRARDLLLSASGSERPDLLSPSDLTKKLSGNIVVIYYVALEDRLLIWAGRSQGVDVFQQSIDLQDLERDVTNYHRAIIRGAVEQIDRAAERLYDTLLRPVAGVLDHESTVVVIPDGPLHAVPFAALRDKATGRFLLEDHAVGVAPSATMFHRSSETLGRLWPARNDRVLVIANPHLDDEDRPTLPNLPAAEIEAGQIKILYPRSEILSGRGASRHSFLERVRHAEIVHFAGHALANERYPLLSRLILARSSDGRPGSVFAHELLGMKLSKTSLVTLAACKTAIGPVKKGEGAMSLARPFLAAGVPAVVATLWDVSDRASQIAFQAFYEALHDGAQPVVALRRAQLHLLRHPDRSLRSPSAWGGFMVLGGVIANGG